MSMIHEHRGQIGQNPGQPIRGDFLAKQQHEGLSASSPVVARGKRYGSCNSPAKGLDRAMFPYIALTKDKEWKPGPYPGVELMLLHKNEQTGGITILRKFHA